MSGKDRRPILLLKWLFALAVLFVLGVFVMVKIDPRPYAAEAAARSDLKYLANVQAEYFDEHDEYTEDLAALRYTNSDGVIVRLEADRDSWAATSEYHHGSFPFSTDIDCALVVGELDVASWGAIDMASLNPGEIRCERA